MSEAVGVFCRLTVSWCESKAHLISCILRLVWRWIVINTERSLHHWFFHTALCFRSRPRGVQALTPSRSLVPSRFQRSMWAASRATSLPKRSCYYGASRRQKATPASAVSTSPPPGATDACSTLCCTDTGTEDEQRPATTLKIQVFLVNKHLNSQTLTRPLWVWFPGQTWSTWRWCRSRVTGRTSSRPSRSQSR